MARHNGMSARSGSIDRRRVLRGAVASAGLIGLGSAGASLWASPASAAVVAPPIISCPAWGARAPRPLNVLPNNPNKILIHHTAGPNSSDTSVAHAHAMARSIQNSHMDANGWPDSGQHFTISRGGHILEGRHHSLPRLQAGSGMVEGTHCPGQNNQAIGIENEGTYISGLPPAALYNRLVHLCAYICQQYRLPATAIFGHRDFRATECPGTTFYNRIPQLRRDVAARLSGGRSDGIGVYRPAEATFYLRGGPAARLGNPHFIPLIGDWNGDGVDTIGVYRQDNRTFYLRNSNTSGEADGFYALGNTDDIPVVGDWNGDGRTSIGVFRPTNGHFYLKEGFDNTGEADHVFQFGSEGDIPFAGDWDGNGRDTVGVYRPSDRTFYLRNSLTTGPSDGKFTFGNPNDLPVIGNWNGDPYDTIGVYRPSTGWFYLKNTNDNSGQADIEVHYGSDGDVPISGNWG
jgi:N-acetylmuramoyl-L-alanine amidase